MSQQQKELPAPSSAATETDLFKSLEAYPWTTDDEFQSGLTAILGPDPQSLENDRLRDLTLHARCFYFSRKFGVDIQFENYRSWRESQPAASLSETPLQSQDMAVKTPLVLPVQDPSAEIKSLSFAEVMELVQSGKPIPGIKDIPDTVLEGRGTEAAKPERQKPWEKAGQSGTRLFENSGP